ncbi:MAG TPA: hypothetical protein PK999_16635, partial [Nitrospira sp.]|nr:hypothetical protein [Nitrospira sp.]
MSTNTNTNAFGILNVQALNKAFNVIFNDQADAKFQTYVVDDYGKHEGGGTAIKSWQMKKYLSALTSALNNTYKVVEGRWLFLKVTEEFIRDQFPGFDCGYAIGGNEMREAV